MVIHEEYDLIDGHKVPQLFINEDTTLTGIHRGGVNVESGRFTLDGVLQGSLNVRTAEPLTIAGLQQGSVALCSGATVFVTGAIEGSTIVESGAILMVEHGGKLAGSLTNNGSVVIRGVFGGSQDGDGDLVIEGDGYIKQPRIENGVHYYEW